MTRDPKKSSPDKRFVLLDRDGTINEERNYLSDPDQVELVSGSAQAIRMLREQGLGLVIVTNQSAVGRGYFDEARLDEVNQRLCQLLEAEGAYVDRIYFCPHLPEDNCRCRKPGTGMVEQAVRDFGFDPTLAMMVGDRDSDIELGQNVGATTFLVASGYGAGTAEDGKTNPDYAVKDLLEAANVILGLVSEASRPVKLGN